MPLRLVAAHLAAGAAEAAVPVALIPQKKVTNIAAELVARAARDIFMEAVEPQLHTIVIVMMCCIKLLVALVVNEEK